MALKRKLSVIPLLLLLCLLPKEIYADSSNNSTEDKIHFLHTYGGGDSILLESNGKFALIDTGENISENIKIIENKLKDRKGEHLDYLIITHAHSDHIGSASGIINTVPVENIIALDLGITHKTKTSVLEDDNLNPLKGKTHEIEYKDTVYYGKEQEDWKSDIYYRDMLNSFAEKTISNYKTNIKYTDMTSYLKNPSIGNIIRPIENKNIQLGDYSLTFNNVYNGYLDENFIEKNKVSSLEDYNATSIWITLKDNKGNKVGLSGDIRSEVAEDLAESNPHMLNDLDLYKMSHHGTNDSLNMIKTLKRSNKEVEFVSLGTGKYHAPIKNAVSLDIPVYLISGFGGNDTMSATLDAKGIHWDSQYIPVTKEQVKSFWFLGDDNYWYYSSAGEIIKNQWLEIDNYWYRFDNEGKALSNGWHFIDNKWYYFAKTNGETSYYGDFYPECAMFESSWIEYKNDWYYVGSNGDMLCNRWINDTRANPLGEWYYLDKEGVMLKGEQEIDNNTFYLSSKPHKAHSGKSYRTGMMYENEWLKLSNGDWKYFKTGGYMAKNETIRIDGVLYKFNSKGICTTPNGYKK